jgi:hypothetical protein
LYPLVVKYLRNTLSIDPQAKSVLLADQYLHRQHTVFEDESEMEEEAGSPPQTQAPQDSCQIVSTLDSLVVDLLVVSNSNRNLAMMSSSKQ